METESKIPGPPIGWTDIIDYEIMERQRIEEENRNSNPLRPSSAGFCGRRLAYELGEHRKVIPKIEKKPMEPHVWRLFKLGYAVERESLSALRLIKEIDVRYGQQILQFFKIKRGEGIKEEWMEGSPDGVVWSETHKGIFDVKSKKDRFSKIFKSEWEETLEDFDQFESLIKLSPTSYYADDLLEFIQELGWEDFLVDNLCQLNLYALSDFIVERGIDHAFILRYNKNSSQHLEIRFRPSKVVYEIVKEKFNRVSLSVDKNEIEKVKRDFTLGSMRCAFCPYSKVCWKEDALKEWFRTFPRKKYPARVAEDETLVALFDAYESYLKTEDKSLRLREELIKTMIEKELYFVQLPNGNMFELKHLKSPKPHFELRRTKL